jgi:mannosyltransferase OCH1-like enzyme
MLVDFLKGMPLNRLPSSSLLPVFPLGERIPKFIHQTFHAPPWRDEIASNVQRLKERNPNWIHRFYDYDDRVKFIDHIYGKEVLRLYNSIDPFYGAARADLFRYLLLYKEGGIYFDMKSSARFPLDSVVRPDDLFLLSRWRREGVDHARAWGSHHELKHLPFGEFQQWFIASAPGHPYLKRVIDYVLRNLTIYVNGIHGTGAYGVLRVTGPVTYTLAIDGIMNEHPHRVVDAITDLGFVYSVFGEGASEAHRSLFPHYTTLDLPIVNGGRARNFIGKSLSFARKKLRPSKNR